MRIGVPKEIKNNEHRVAVTPSGVMQLTQAGHHVIVEHAAGESIGFTDDQYRAAGARIADRDTVWREAEMIMKVKEPLPEEYRYFRQDLILSLLNN